jgi:nucleolin
MDEKKDSEELSVSEKKGEEVELKGKKERKPYEWTPKRLEAFNKMREGLVTKVEITKKIKQEQKDKEKEEIKKRVRAIMHKTSLKSKDSSSEEKKEDSSSDSDSSVEKVKKGKKAKVKKEKMEKKESKEVLKKKKRPIESSSSSNESTEAKELDSSEESDSDKEKRFAKPPKNNVATMKQKEKTVTQIRETGKAPKQTQYLNPMDQFILL